MPEPTSMTDPRKIDPPQEPAHPLSSEAMDLLRAQVEAGGPLTAGQARLLLDHIDWLDEEVERVSEARDNYRDKANELGRRLRSTVTGQHTS